MNRITKLFDEFASRGYVKNPPGPAGEDDITLFLRAMDASGKLGGFTEGEWIEFGKREEMSGEEISELIEQAAGWVPDTSRKGRAPEPAVWTNLKS